jgi:hypothetical protein
MRCLAKCIATFGIGLYIYAGSDLPSDAIDEEVPDLTAEANLWIGSIKDCTTIDELKVTYGKAYAALSKDKSAVEKIASAKDLQKGTLMALQS